MILSNSHDQMIIKVAQGWVTVPFKHIGSSPSCSVASFYLTGIYQLPQAVHLFSQIARHGGTLPSRAIH